MYMQTANSHYSETKVRGALKKNDLMLL